MVANAILAAPEDTGAVFALCGSFGMGKTWTAQRVEEFIGEGANILWFEPWMVGTPEALAREFFLELGRAVLWPGQDPAAQARRGRFYRYAAQILDVTSMVASPLSTLGVPGAGLVKAASDAIKKPVQVAADALKELGQAPSLRETRDALAKDLAQLEKPLVVVVDDIDRLTDDEVRTLFRLVKACADFPKVRYLLLYDRSQVVPALSGAYKDGEAFLDKIVRSAFDLPHITELDRTKLLSDRIEAIVDKMPKGEAFERLQMVFDHLLLPGLPTPRLVDRFATTATDLLAGIRHPEGLDIDIADWLTLEFLRQRESGLYSSLRGMTDPQPGGRFARTGDAKKAEEAEIAAIEAALPKEAPRSDLAREALNLLGGPRTTQNLAQIFDGNEAMARNRRFRSDLWRPVYFGFDAGRAALSTQDFVDLKAALASTTEEDLLVWMTRFDDYDRRERIAAILGIRVAELSNSERLCLLHGLLRWSESRPYDGRPFSLGRDTTSSLFGEVGTEILIRLKSSLSPVDILRQAVDETKGIICAVDIWQLSVWANEPGGRETWATLEDLETLRSKWLPQVRELVVNGRIWNHPNPSGLYHAFHNLASEEAETWFTTMQKDPSQLPHYINKMMVQSMLPNGSLSSKASTDKDYLQLLREVQDSLLTEEGMEARRRYLEAAEWEISLIKRYQGQGSDSRPEDIDVNVDDDPVDGE